MKIQSLSICVPTKKCPNNCHFCVAHMHKKDYKNQIESNKRFVDLYTKDYKNRLMFARDNGCNTIMFTGDGEAITNMTFLEKFALWNESLPNPFRWLELQSSGILLHDENLRFLRSTIGINTISLSLSSIFSSDVNARYNRTKKSLKVDIDKVCSEIKRYDFNLRLSLNMSDVYNSVNPIDIFNRAKELGADQITFRKLYMSGVAEENEQNKWIEEHKYLDHKWAELRDYILKNGTALEILPFGATKYSIHDFAVVVDDDCMSTEIKGDTFKYLVLRENCKLYSKWEDKNSLIF